MGDWLVCGLIILVATVGKFGGTLLAGRATGLGWRDAAGLGVLMNTRGLMELIVLNVGLDLGRDLADAVHDDGADGAGDDGGHGTDSAAAPCGARRPRSPGDHRDQPQRG